MMIIPWEKQIKDDLTSMRRTVQGTTWNSFKQQGVTIINNLKRKYSGMDNVIKTKRTVLSKERVRCTGDGAGVFPLLEVLQDNVHNIYCSICGLEILYHTWLNADELQHFKSPGPDRATRERYYRLLKDLKEQFVRLFADVHRTHVLNTPALEADIIAVVYSKKNKEMIFTQCEYSFDSIRSYFLKCINDTLTMLDGLEK